MHGDCPTANSVNFFQSLLSGSQATYFRRPVLLLRTGNMINVGDRDVGSSLCQRNCNSASDTASPSSNKGYLTFKCCHPYLPIAWNPSKSRNHKAKAIVLGKKFK